MRLHSQSVVLFTLSQIYGYLNNFGYFLMQLFNGVAKKQPENAQLRLLVITSIYSTLHAFIANLEKVIVHSLHFSWELFQLHCFPSWRAIRANNNNYKNRG